MRTSNYKELKVWQKAMDLTIEVYGLTRQFPKEELYALSDQLKRAVVSIPSNIAEGHGRNSIHEFIRFLNISRGSLYEVETQLEISERLGYINTEVISKNKTLITEISKMLNSLISYLNTQKPKN
jgi:four helix bundle protein